VIHLSNSKGTIKAAYGKDNSSLKIDGKKLPSMGGSTTNLSHSLKGVSANQRHGKSGK
jgi:hypothetical protein